MKTWLKLLVSATVALLVMWLCSQVFHLESIMTTVVSIIVALAANVICDKVGNKK